MSKIEWTDETWNPIIGCSRVSQGCVNCYAETIAGRFGNGKPTVYSGLTQIVNGRSVWTGQIKETRQLLQPLSWKKPKRIFVNSMSDLFHGGVTDEQIDRIFAVMALCPQHTFQVLTKRPERMRWYLSADNPRYTIRRIFDAAEKIDPVNGYRFDCDIYDPLDNVWLGVSVENQATAEERIPLLLQTPAAVRFISAEPLLGAIDLTILHREASAFDRSLGGFERCVYFYLNSLEGSNGILMNNNTAHEEPIGTQAHLDWVIVGGESGPGARPMHPDWARSLRDQCEAAGVAFFFKQWGEWLPDNQNPNMIQDPPPPASGAIRVGKKAAGALLDGREWRQMPGEAR